MIKVEIDTIPIEVQRVRVPRYRGAVPRPIELHGLAATYDVIRAHVSARDTVTLKITAPNNPGPSQNDIIFNVGPLLIDNLIKQKGGRLWTLTLYDRRMLLATRICPRDFNISTGNATLPGTEATDSIDALRKLSADIDLISANLDPGAFGGLLALPPPKDTALAGYTAMEAFENLSDLSEADLDCSINGSFRFAHRADLHATPGLTAKLQSLPWREPPPFLGSVVTRRNLPAQVRVMFPERCTVLLVGRSDTVTISSVPSGVLAVELEQVYVESGRYFTLAELVLEFFGSAQVGISDAAIAACYMTDTLQALTVNGQALSQDNDQSRRFIAAIKDGWRRLWRINTPATEFGAWSDHAFGRLRNDGSLDPLAVICEWVEFFAVIGASESRFIGVNASENRTQPSPFIPSWESGPESRVIRLNPGRATPRWGEFKAGEMQHSQNVAVPGRLNNPLKVNSVNAIDDGQGNSFTLPGFRPTEIENPTKARFNNAFVLGIYMTMTRRAPQNTSRFHSRDVAGVQGGTQPRHEIYVPDTVCYRDAAVSASVAQRLGIAQVNGTAEGLGPILNDTALQAKANTTTSRVLTEEFLDVAGEGVVESAAAFRNMTIEGPIESITLEMDTEESGAVIGTRIAFGNLGSARARENRKIDAAPQEAREDGGKIIV